MEICHWKLCLKYVLQYLQMCIRRFNKEVQIDLSELEQLEMFSKIWCLKNGQEEGLFKLGRRLCAHLSNGLDGVQCQALRKSAFI